MLKLKNWGLIAIIGLKFAGCATTDNHPRESANPSASKKSANNSKTNSSPTVKSDDPAYREALQEFKRKNYGKVSEIVKTYERSGKTKSPVLSALYNLQGLSYLIEKNSTLAIKAFQKSIQQNNSPQNLPFLQFNLASSQFQGQLIDDAFTTLTEISPNTLDEETQDKLALLKARVFRKKEMPGEALRELLESLRYISKPNLSRELEIQLESMKDATVLTPFSHEFINTPGGDMVLFHLATLDYRSGNTPEARLKLEDLSKRARDPNLAERARELIQTSAEKITDVPSLSPEAAFIETDPKSIGVLLPLTGKFASYGKDAIQSIGLGLQIFGPLKGAAPFEMVIEDSGETEEQAVAALEKLVKEHHVIAVIGPLTSKGLEKVAERSIELGVPLLTLTQKEPPQVRSLFSLGLTAKAQAEVLAKHVIQKQGFKNFVILAPEGKFGNEYAQAFWNEVEELGGSIVGYELYPEGQTDFRQYIDKLSGLAQTGARIRELEELADMRVRDKIKKRNRKTEHYFALTPIVDFDAVFLPDEAKVVGQIIPTFKYRDIDKVQLLGPSTWRSQDLLDRAGPAAEGALLSDAFLETSEDPAVRQFVERYRATFGKTAGLIDALGFDAAQILYSALNIAGDSVSNRNEVADKIMALQKYQGVTGTFIFKDDHLERGLKLIAIRSGQFAEISETQTNP